MPYIENDATLTCYIFNIHQQILIIFGRHSYRVCDIISLFNLSCPFAIISLICCEITNAKTTHFWRHWLFVNMPYTEEGKILINNLFDLKCNNGKHLVSEFSSKGWNIGLVYQLLQKLGGSTVVPAATDNAVPAQLITRSCRWTGVTQKWPGEK